MWKGVDSEKAATAKGTQRGASTRVIAWWSDFALIAWWTGIMFI